MATPNTLARFIKSQRQAVEKSAAPRFEEISDNAVDIHRATPSFDNGTVAEMRNNIAADGTPIDDIAGNLPAGDLLNPKETQHNNANPGVNKTASIIDAVRASLGQAPLQQKAAAAPARALSPVSEVGNDVLLKVAHSLLSTEEGCRLVEGYLEKAAGAKDAADFMRAAINQKDFIDTVEMHKAAAVSTTLNRAAQIESQLRSSGISEQDAFVCIKQAAIHEHNLSMLDHPMLKAAYAEGADDQAAMEQGVEGGGKPEIPMGGEHLSEEEIVQILQAMIQKGEISEEDVKAALTELSQGGEAGGPPAEGGQGGPPPGAGGPPQGAGGPPAGPQG